MKDRKRIGKRIASIGLAVAVTASTVLGGHVYKTYASWSNAGLFSNNTDLISVTYTDDSDYGAILTSTHIKNPSGETTRTYTGIGAIEVHSSARLRVAENVNIAPGENGFDVGAITLMDGELEVLAGSSLTVPRVASADGYTGSSIDNAGNLTITEAYINAGILNNSGTFEAATFSGDAGTITNSGTIKANVITLDATKVLASTGEFELTGSGSSLVINNCTGEFPCKLVIQKDTTITTDGGSLTVKVVDDNGSTLADNLTLSGNQSGETAMNLLSPTVTLSIIDADGDELPSGSTILYGTSSTVTATVTKPDGTVDPDASVTFQRSYNATSGTYEDWVPEETGPNSLAGTPGTDVYINAIVAPKDGEYIGAYAQNIPSVHVRYLTLDDMNPGASDHLPYYPITFTGNVDSNGWATSNLTMEPPAGYLLTSTHSFGDGDSWDFTPYRYYTAETQANSDVMYAFKRIRDGATTNMYSIDELVFNPEDLLNIRFDLEDPEVVSATLDGESIALSDGASIVGDKLTFEVRDENLDVVTIDDVDYYYNDIVEDTVGRYVEGAIVATPGTSEHSIVARDLAGRSIVVKFRFTKSRVNAHAAVSVPNITYGNPVTPVLTTNSDGKDGVVYSYKALGAGDETYTKEVPTNAGEYVVRAEIPQTDLYNALTVTGTFTIAKATAAVTASMDTTYVGTDLRPNVSTNSDATEPIRYYYKKADEAEEAYSETIPSLPGDYTVRVVIPESGNYNETATTVDFTTQYLPAPAEKYTISGTKKKNDFYTSDVYLVAPEGYRIAEKPDGSFDARMLYGKNTTTYSLQRIADGAKTDGIVIGEKIKVDKVAPTMINVVDQRGGKLSLRQNGKYYADTVTFAVDDENFDYLTINGKQFDAKGENDTFTLDSKGGDQKFTIQIVDKAGNVSKYQFTLLACWMKSFTIPNGTKVVLTSGQKYNLESGYWTIRGDGTVYSGGNSFYVNAKGEYVFVQKDKQE